MIHVCHPIVIEAWGNYLNSPFLVKWKYQTTTLLVHIVDMERKQCMWTCFENHLFSQGFVFSFLSTACLVSVHDASFSPCTQ